jgi:hypothetical protein
MDPRLIVPPLMIELYLLELSARFLPLQPVKKPPTAATTPPMKQLKIPV